MVKKKDPKKGDTYTCEICGMVVVVNEDCTCVECDLVCCGKPMKPKKEKCK